MNAANTRTSGHEAAVRYVLPQSWVRYDLSQVQTALVQAQATILALTQLPYQRSWADKLQALQLKREVAGTSRIEGAEFTEKELERAMHESPEELETRSQKQAAAAKNTYQWIAGLPNDRPVDLGLILEVHRRLVTGCDDDHCPPGVLRGKDQNVTFGAPRHRGVEGGPDCKAALERLSVAASTEFRGHPPLVQALALHYHFAAMHPFLDGNGRTARALEALMLQRLGLRDTLFIAMSNYYYEEKTSYLQALNAVRAKDHDLTDFLAFALRGIERQCRALFDEINLQIKKALFISTATDLFGRLSSPRKRVVSQRQLRILNLLLDQELGFAALMAALEPHYRLLNPRKALIRDLAYLLTIRAIAVPERPDDITVLRANLEWPKEIDDNTFLAASKKLPKSKVLDFLSR